MFKLYQFDTLESTNDYLKEHHEAYHDKDVILTLKQSKGRGRFDRSWDSENALTFSILFNGNKNHHVFISSLAILYALRDHDIHADIKWPNDLLINNKKVAGILIEKIYSGDTFEKIIVGIGINMQMPVDEELQESAAAICQYTQASSIGILSSILENYEKLLYQDFEEIYQQYLSHVLKNEILIEGELWQIIGVNREGHLLIQQNDEEKQVISGEITLGSRINP